MSVPKISIIVPNYNHSSFLEERLDSIFNQTYSNFEVILLDDASTDGSVSILKSYENHSKVSHIIINQENSGSPFVQWKRGMELAQGEYIWLAESDDTCDRRFLEVMMHFIAETNEPLDLVYCQSVDIDEHGNQQTNRIEYTSNFQPNIWSDHFTMEGNTFIQQYLKAKCIIPNASAVLFKRSALESNPLDANHLSMRICGDWFFWIKIIRNGKIGFVSETLNYFRHHPNVTRNHSQFNKLYSRCFEEKKIRDYLHKKYEVTQEEEMSVLYQKWFVRNQFSKLFTRQFYTVKLKQTSIFKYLRIYLKTHKTKDKILKKITK